MSAQYLLKQEWSEVCFEYFEFNCSTTLLQREFSIGHFYQPASSFEQTNILKSYCYGFGLAQLKTIVCFNINLNINSTSFNFALLFIIVHTIPSYSIVIKIQHFWYLYPYCRIQSVFLSKMNYQFTSALTSGPSSLLCLYQW